MKPAQRVTIDLEYFTRSTWVSATAEGALPYQTREIDVRVQTHDKPDHTLDVANALVEITLKRFVYESAKVGIRACPESHAQLELNVWELRPLAAALSRAVAIADEQRFLPERSETEEIVA